MINAILSIDLGNKGGLSIVPIMQHKLDRPNTKVISLEDKNYIIKTNDLIKDYTIMYVFIEEPLVHKFKPVWAIASNCEDYGWWKCYCSLKGLPTPIPIKISKWKGYFKLKIKGNKKATKEDGLNILLNLGYSKQLFNKYGVTGKVLSGFQDGVCDSLLIGECGFNLYTSLFIQ